MSGSMNQHCSYARLLGNFFGDESEAKALMCRHLSFISVEPVIGRRLTIFTTMPVFVLPWEIFLLESGFRRDQVCSHCFWTDAMLTDYKEGWFHRDSDERRVQIKVIRSLVLHFSATHEICLVAPSGIVRPFTRSNSEKVTTVYGPKQGDRQIEELQLLRDSGWTVFYQSTMLPDEGAGNTMLCAETVCGGRTLLGQDTETTMLSAEDERRSIEKYLRDAKFDVSDAQGIMIDLRGLVGAQPPGVVFNAPCNCWKNERPQFIKDGIYHSEEGLF